MLFRTIDIAQTKGCVDVQTRYKLEFVNDIMGRTSGFDDYDNLLYVLSEVTNCCNIYIHFIKLQGYNNLMSQVLFRWEITILNLT